MIKGASGNAKQRRGSDQLHGTPDVNSPALCVIFFCSCPALFQEPNVAAEETDISTISPLSSAGVCRSISRSYSSPEPDDGAGGSAGPADPRGSEADGKQPRLPQSEQQPQYVHCSSTTASVPGEFTNRHRTQVRWGHS